MPSFVMLSSASPCSSSPGHAGDQWHRSRGPGAAVAGHSSALRLPEKSQGSRERSAVEGGAWEGMVSDSNTSFPIKHAFSASSALLSGAVFASWVSQFPQSLLKGGGPIEPVLPTHFQLNPDSSFR